MRIFWTEKALLDLDEISHFYQQFANSDVAQKILNQLIDKADILTSYPGIGTIETFENTHEFAYRFIVEGHHKLIYRLSENEQLIYIVRVFDTRRNPKKKDSEFKD
jgi:toxin ParE1/3/4